MDSTRRFKKVKIALMRSPLFVGLSGIMMMGRTTMTTDVPTACTNGRDEMYNPEFVFKFGDKAAGFIIVHENMHKAARHLQVYTKLHAIDPQLTNAACDYWINARITKVDPMRTLVEMPQDEDGKQVGLFDAKYDGWTVAKIFEDLREQQQQGGEGGEGGGEGEGGFDEHDWDGAKQMSAAQAKELEQDIKQAIRQGEMAAKKMGVGAGKNLLGLGELLESRVDWRSQLREFMTSTCTDKQESSWRRPNRRYLYQDLIMPTLMGESINEVVFARDASGSMMCRNRLTKVTSEMVALAKALQIEKIHLIDWDGAVSVRGVYTAQMFEDAPEVSSVMGGGGTDPRCVAAYLKEKRIKPNAVVMFTDGEVPSWGDWEVPVLWLIANSQKITASVGKTINVGED
jgi:predicted metal-dependent peptidase